MQTRNWYNIMLAAGYCWNVCGKIRPIIQKYIEILICYYRLYCLHIFAAQKKVVYRHINVALNLFAQIGPHSHNASIWERSPGSEKRIRYVPSLGTQHTGTNACKYACKCYWTNCVQMCEKCSIVSHIWTDINTNVRACTHAHTLMVRYNMWIYVHIGCVCYKHRVCVVRLQLHLVRLYRDDSVKVWSHKK